MIDEDQNAAFGRQQCVEADLCGGHGGFLQLGWYGMLIGCYWFSSRVGIPRLKPPFRATPLAAFPDVCFASVACLPARTHVIGPGHQVGRTLDCRTPNEARAFNAFKCARAVGLVEDRP